MITNFLHKVSLNARTWLLAIFVFGAHWTLAQEQEFTFMGKVTEGSNTSTIPGATVSIEGTSFGTITATDGSYSFNAQIEPGTYKISARFVGFATATVQVTVTQGQQQYTQDFVLQEDILNLDDVVVTGTSVATSRKQLGNAIATIKAADLQNSGSVAADQALAGKISGALVQQNSGDPAGGISVRLRGASTISGSSDPLYIIDGVIVNNSSNEIVNLGGTAQNRLVDINPSDIERIEVIKGAAAAAIYGSRASNGVVQIFTKRGAEGKPKISFTSSLRINSLRKEIDYNNVNLAWENPFDNSNLNTITTQRFNYQDQFFDTGVGTENFVSVSGGTDKTKYFASGSYLYNEGIIKNTNFERFGARLNLDQYLNSWLSFNLGLNYTQSSSADIPNGGISNAIGAITGFVFSDNTVDPNANASGVYPVTSLLVPRTNPLEAVNRFDFAQRTNRIVTSFGLNANPGENWNISYKLGVDTYSQSATGFIPVGNTSPNATGLASKGEANVFQSNSDLNISYTKELSSDLVSTTVIGGTWQYERAERLSLRADRLAPTVQVATGGTIIGQLDARSEVSYWGAFLQETLSLKDKLFLTGAIRLDGASVFGEDERDQLYAKASASYLLSSEDFWENTFGTGISTFKIRASWGQAGNLTALGAFDRFSNYNPLALNGSSGVLPSTLLGNEDLAPERQEEFEIGFDLGLLKNRVGIEFTYYKQEVTDLLLERELASSTGFVTRFENIGSLENKGIELLARASLVQSDDFSWNTTVTYSSNDNVVTGVVGDRITLPGSFATSFVIPGESLGVFYRQFYAREANGDISLDANGYPFRGVTSDGSSSTVIGDPNPDWFGSIINELSYKGFNLRLQFDAVQGFDVFNWNRRLLDNVIFGGGANVGRELSGDRLKGFGRAQAGIFEEFVEDGSFVKLRELALSYSFTPQSSTIGDVRVSLVGRNLISFDDYTGWDPEINTPGQSNGVRGFDFAGVPIPKTYQLGVTINFK